MKISHVKSSIQTILTNLNELQTCRDNLVHNPELNVETKRIDKCRESVERGFACLQPEAIQTAVNHLKKRKKLRARRAKKREMKKKNCRQSSSVSRSKRLGILQKPDIQKSTRLRKHELQSAKKYLSIIKSLEVLHKLKGGGDFCKLEESLNPIRSIWQAIEEKVHTDDSESMSTEKQWDLVLFGQDTDVELKCGRRDFMERRCIWDTYLVSGNDPTGSHVPIGWVCPKEDARPDWKQFQV